MWQTAAEGHCDRRCPTWKSGWSKGVSQNSSMQKRWYSLIVTDTCWTFMETNQWMWVQWGGSGVFQQWQQYCGRQAVFCMASHSCLTEKGRVCQSVHPHKSDNGGDYDEKIVFYSWEFALSNSAIMLFVPVVVSMEINRKYYLQSIQHKIKILPPQEWVTWTWHSLWCLSYWKKKGTGIKQGWGWSQNLERKDSSSHCICWLEENTDHGTVSPASNHSPSYPHPSAFQSSGLGEVGCGSCLWQPAAPSTYLVQLFRYLLNTLEDLVHKKTFILRCNS